MRMPNLFFDTFRQPKLYRGFEIPDEKAGDGHVFLSLQGRKRYRFKVSSTPDEYRTRQNEFNKVVKKSVSIYKNPKTK